MRYNTSRDINLFLEGRIMFENIMNSLQNIMFEPDQILSQAANLGLFGSIISVMTGIVYMMYGWRLFRVMVAIIFAFFGFYAGVYIGDLFGWAMAGGVILAILLAVASLPLMKLATGIIVALATASLAGYLWHISNMPEKYTVFCAGAGLILGGLLGYYILMLAVIAYSSLLGASVVLTGFIGFTKAVSPEYQASANGMIESAGTPMNIPIWVLLALLTAAGIMIQLHIHGLSDGDKKEREV
jgi:hypothetical protein